MCLAVAIVRPNTKVLKWFNVLALLHDDNILRGIGRRLREYAFVIRSCSAIPLMERCVFEL
jgi:hypothetical protein